MPINKISVIIPAFNEEKYLPALFESLAKAKTFLLSKKNYEIETILVDNNSTDKTSQIANQFGAKVIPESKRLIATPSTAIHTNKTAGPIHQLNACQALSMRDLNSMEPMTRIELVTSPLPRECSTN